MAMTISQNGVNLIKGFEGCVLHAYQDAVGVWTIGYGHTSGVTKGQTITQAQADKMLVDELNTFSTKVAALIKVPVNQNQFDALVSFAYNLGVGALASSSLLKYVNANDFKNATLEFPKWCHAGGKTLPGLVARRNKEQALFNTPVPKPVVVAKPVTKPAPKPVAKPVVKSKPIVSHVTYTVVKGDTLSGISSKFKVPVATIKTLNKLKTDTIYVGQKLFVK